MTHERIRLRFWQSGERLTQISNLLDEWFDRMQASFKKVAFDTDPETCSYSLAVLTGRARGIERLPGEPEPLFRRRVKYALSNALNAGSAAGFEVIFRNLGLGSIEQEERRVDADWDIIFITVDESVFALMPEALFGEIVRLHGLTCRRYALDARAELKQPLSAADFTAQYDYAITE